MNGDNFYYEDSIVGENEEKKKNSFRKSVLTKSVTLAFSHDFIDYLDESEKLTLEKASYMLLKN